MKNSARILCNLLMLMILIGLAPVGANAAAGTYEEEYSVDFPFSMAYGCAAADGTEVYYSNRFPVITVLRNEWVGKRPELSGSSQLYGYRVDALDAGTAAGPFERGNLEDCEELDWRSAGKIRAIVLQSYPRQSIEAMEIRANLWLRSQGRAEIRNLQLGEAVLASQAAIWKTVYDNSFRLQSLYSGYSDLSEETPTGNSESNANRLFAYLCALEPAEPQRSVVSEDILDTALCTRQRQEDGTVTVTVTVRVEADVDSTDSLLLSAACGSLMEQKPVTKAGIYQFSFRGLHSCEDVTLEISGEQRGSDVYLFRSQQSGAVLTAYDSSYGPVSASRRIPMEDTFRVSVRQGQNGSGLTQANAAALGVINVTSLFLLMAAAVLAVAENRRRLRGGS